MQKLHDYLWESPTPPFTIKDGFIMEKASLMVYRLLALMTMAGVYMWVSGFTFLSFKDLSNWGITFVWLYFALICLCYFIYYDETKVNLTRIYAFWKFVVIVAEFAFSLQVLIPLYYWTLLYPTDTAAHQTLGFEKTICAHGVVAVLIWIETICNRIRFYKRHLILILLLDIAYATINLVYTKIYGPIYPNLTWDDFSTVYLVAGSIVWMCLGFLAALGLSRWKQKKKASRALVDSYDIETD